jgi:hypothetical protein
VVQRSIYVGHTLTGYVRLGVVLRCKEVNSSYGCIWLLIMAHHRYAVWPVAVMLNTVIPIGLHPYT